MFRVAVCDDDVWICREIRRILEENHFDMCAGITADCYTSGEELLTDLKTRRFELLILDIELPDIDGIAVAQYVRENLHDDQTQILYISGKSQYCMDLFESMPLQFLVKPLEEKEVVRLVQKAVYLKYKKGYMFQFQKGNMMCRIPYGEILYFESRNKQIRLKSEQEEYYFYEKLDNVEKDVASGNFIRIHKSYLVNYHYIKSYGAENIKMLDEEVLPVSRKYRQKAMEQILEYARRRI